MTYARLTSFSFSASSFCFCFTWFSFLMAPRELESAELPGCGSTYSRVSFGFSMRLTSANLRVFFALTWVYS